MIAGKVMMDRNAPPGLRDTPEASYDESRALIERWHGQGRQRYAVTPRFAITSTEAQLEAAGALNREHPWRLYADAPVGEPGGDRDGAPAFPGGRHYTDVYDRYGLLGERSLFGHCIHLEEDEVRRLSESRSVAVFCPTSNLFIGSGLFDLKRLSGGARPGAGRAGDRCRRRHQLFHAPDGGRGLQGAATGRPEPAGAGGLPHDDARQRAGAGDGRQHRRDRAGRFADLVVLDARATPAMAHRMETVDGDLDEELFVLMTMGDDRAVRATYFAGERAHEA